MTGQHHLAKGALSTPQVLFCCVTGAAPIAAMMFNGPVGIYGAGWAVPGAFIIATIVLTIFSVGYIEMARRVTAAGGFYSFVSHGFGNILGMGTAMMMAFCYLVFSAAVTGVTSYFAVTTISEWFGVDVPVWVFLFGTIILMVAFTFFHIQITAKILGRRAKNIDQDRDRQWLRDIEHPIELAANKRSIEQCAYRLTCIRLELGHGLRRKQRRNNPTQTLMIWRIRID